MMEVHGATCGGTESKKNPFTAKSDQLQISPVASPEILPTQYEELGFS